MTTIPLQVPATTKRWLWLACGAPFVLLLAWSLLLIGGERRAQAGLQHCATWTQANGEYLEAFEQLHLQATTVLQGTASQTAMVALEAARRAVQDTRHELGRKVFGEEDERLDSVDRSLRDYLSAFDQACATSIPRAGAGEGPTAGPSPETRDQAELALKHEAVLQAFRRLDTHHRLNLDRSLQASLRNVDQLATFAGISLLVALAFAISSGAALWLKARGDGLLSFNRALVTALPEALVVWDRTGRVLAVNPALGRLTGRPEHGTRTGSRVEEILPVAVRCRLERTDAADSTEFNLHQASGKLVAVEATTASAASESGPMHLALLRNSTRVLESERRLLESERWAAIGRNTVSICRDIQRCLLPLPLALEILKEEHGGRWRRDEAQAELARGVESAGALLRQMAAFAGADRVEEDARIFDLHAAVQDVIESFYGQGIPLACLSIELASTEALVVGPPERFKAALAFLVQRALDATGGAPSVQVQTWDEEEEHHLEVRDSGDAIPESQLGWVFEPSYVSSMETPESGFGLFNVASVIRGMGGSIGAERLEGGWTCFRVRIPKER